MPNEIRLTPDAGLVLEKIEKSRQVVGIDELSNQTGFDIGKVSSLVELLHRYGLINKETKEIEEYKLTSRGKASLKNELIERRLMKYLFEHGSLHIKDVQNTLKVDKSDVSAGIGVLKKEGMIKIDKGSIELLDRNKTVSDELQEALEKINQHEPIPVEIAEVLLKRGLVEKSVRHEIFISPLKHGKQIKIVEEVSNLTPDLIISGKWRNVNFKPYNIKSKPRIIYPGKYHPYRHFHDHLREKLIALGFKEMKGPLIEQEFWNFDSLFAPQDHPAREDSDIFLIENPTHGILPDEIFVENVKQTHQDGWITGSRGYKYRWDPRKAARLLLRPQGTAISARTLRKVNPPEKYFSIAKCFRPDDIDATHGVEFYQVEGIVCDPSITFRDLLGILKIFAEDIAGATEVNFRPDYYPFTSPSVELSARHPTLGRIEFGGAGIFRPEVVRPYGIDYPVIAWGLGVDRLFMVKNKIDDIRELFSQDLNWLREVEISSGIEVDE